MTTIRERMERMSIGKRIRMERIVDRNSGRSVIVPMDHGVTSGPIYGLTDMKQAVNAIAEGGATVEEAIRLGADAVSMHVNVGADSEPEMLEELGETAMICEEWSMPLLAMMYPRGKKVKNEHDPEMVMHVARVGAELGADIIKTNYTGDPDTFKDVIQSCPVPVIIAGGPKANTDAEVLKMVEDAISAGASGVSIGRNVFQHENPTKMTIAISKIVHEGITAAEAMEMLK